MRRVIKPNERFEPDDFDEDAAEDLPISERVLLYPETDKDNMVCVRLWNSVLLRYVLDALAYAAKIRAEMPLYEAKAAEIRREYERKGLVATEKDIGERLGRRLTLFDAVPTFDEDFVRCCEFAGRDPRVAHDRLKAAVERGLALKQIRQLMLEAEKPAMPQESYAEEWLEVGHDETRKHRRRG